MKDSPAPSRRGSRGLLWRVVRSVALAYVIVVVLVFIFQRRLIYFPIGGPVPLPSGPRFDGLVEVSLAAADGTPLKAWHWPGKNATTLVIFHGNAGNRGHRDEWLAELRSTGAGLFIVDYRGFGGSGGSPTEEGLYQDAEAAIQWLTERGQGSLVYVGESLGSAVALEAAIRKPPAAVILQGAFSSLSDVGQRAYSYLPVRWLLREKFDSFAKIEKVTCPILFIHGSRDSIVPMEFGKKLFERAPGRKEWLEIPGEHNDAPWVLVPAYSRRIAAFLGLPSSG